MLTLPYYLQSMRWIVPAGFMLGSAPAFYAVWGGWRIASAILPVRIFEAGDEMLYSMYQRMVLFCFENLSGIEIIVYGDVDKLIQKPENVIFMCNHQCTVDWMVADMLAVMQGSVGRIRYILKDGLKYLPLYGYYFRQHSCIYVKRSGKFNQQKAEKQLDMFTNNGTPFWMVVFPEGTRFNPDLPEIIEKSRSYAKAQGQPVFEHLLTPRLKALQMCVQRLRPSADAVYDVTVAYSSTLNAVADGQRRVGPTLADFLQGQCKELHVHVKRIPIDEVPVDESEFLTWLNDQFTAKDRWSSYYSITGLNAAKCCVIRGARYCILGDTVRSLRLVAYSLARNNGRLGMGLREIVAYGSLSIVTTEPVNRRVFSLVADKICIGSATDWP